jgi:ribosomal protein S18 acetylase RimI-like enzyme
MRPLSPNSVLSVSRTEDLDRVRALLSRDPYTAIYMLGDLEPAYAGFCVWWLATSTPLDGPPEDVAALLVYTGYAEPVVLTFGEPDGIGAIVLACGADLPRRALVHLALDHVEAVDRGLELDRLRPMLRLRRASPAPAPWPVPAGLEAPELLAPRDTGDIRELLRHYPDQFFEQHQVTAGRTVGIRDADGLLVAMAGTHVLSRTDGVAALGNVVTHPAHRRRGLAKACTTALIGLVEAEGVSRLGVSLQRRNVAAMGLFLGLGFESHTTWLEGTVVRGEGGPAADRC